MLNNLVLDKELLRQNMSLTKLPCHVTLTGKMIYIFVCKRCGHEWASKREHPIRCAKCKTPYWDTERKQKRINAK